LAVLATWAVQPVHAQDIPLVPPLAAEATMPTLELAQVIPHPQPAGPPPTPVHTGIKAMVRELGEDVKYLPSRENAMWAGIGAALALSVHPADEHVNHAMINSDFAKTFFKPGAVIGQLPTLLGTSVVVYAVGRAKDEPRVSHVGMDLIRALAISEGLTMTMKYATRRERPDHSGKTSFPSGHSADTFAFATALERHLGWRYFVPAYIGASYVAISRLPANRHWLSDTVAGAAVGIIAGRTVTGHEMNKYALSFIPVRGGAAIGYQRAW
jgi:membrane-associated phospholipid phosphatase